MKKMKIVLLSGGTGNTALVNGIKYWYPNCELNIIVNAYDDGKSTGICRKIVNTLGVSDIRKNHEKQLKLYRPYSPYLDLYSSRLDLPKGKECDFVLGEIEKVEKKHGCVINALFKNAVIDFFNNPDCKNYSFKDFNIMNIVYSAIWQNMDYALGNSEICRIIGIDSNVILNSYDNVNISATTLKGKKLPDEGSIVDFCNNQDVIKKIHYSVKPSAQKLNPYALELIKSADLIIISTGTFWSSILPTIEYGDMYDYLNDAKAKKIWVLNSTRDNDSWAQNPSDFVLEAECVGLEIEQWKVIHNLDCPIENLIGKGYHLGLVESGKNDPKLVGQAIFDCYFGIPKGIQQVLVDFDGTIYSKECPYDGNVLYYLSKMDNLTLITGNTLNHIENIYGKEFIKSNKIWANANSEYFVNGKCKKRLKSNRVKLKDYDLLYNVKPTVDDYCIKFRPITNNRETICQQMNDILEEKYPDYIARCTGKTTIDILNKANNKGEIYYKCKFYKYKTLYIGDEIENGNDKAIASLCDYSINVNNPYETGIILKLLQ